MNAIKRSVIEFCAGSWIWVNLQDPMNMQAGIAEYDLEPPTGSDVSSVLTVELDAVPLQPRNLDWLSKEIPGWRTTKARPKYFTQVDTDQIILAPLPEVNLANGLTIATALQPSQSAASFPKWIYTQFVYTIIDGAVAKLMLMPGRPWTDLLSGADKRQRFENGIANAKNTATAALGRAPVRVSYQH